MKSFKILILVSLLVFAGAETFSSNKVELIKSHSFKVSSQTLFEVRTDGGEIEITPGNNYEVQVEIYGSKKSIEHYDFIFKSDDEVIKVIGERKTKWNFLSNLSLKYKIKIPLKFDINASTAGGDVKVGGISGKHSLNTSGGDVWADEVSGTLKARTSGGDIKIFASNTEIDAKSSGGDIWLEYSGDNKGMDLVTSGGYIKIYIPKNFNAEIDAVTLGGDIKCEFELNKVRSLSKHKINGEINNGGRRISAKTSGGDIRVNFLK